MNNLINLITEHIDIWTTAQTPKTNGGRGRGSNANGQSHGIKKLRELILELAVRGKLVPQNPNDEPASVLLAKIAKEKKQLIKVGKIKKQKPLPAISDEEKPFELPEGWEWARLIELCVLENGDRSKNYPNKSVLVDSGVPFINAGHLKNGKINMSEMNFIPMARFELLRSGKVNEGDILYCLRGSLGKTAMVHDIGLGAVASSLVIVRLFSPIYSVFVHKYFDSPLAMSIMRKYDNGTAQPNLSATDLGKFDIPLPPLAEQHRIVAKVDELMAICDQLEQQQTDSIATHQTLVETLLSDLVRPQAVLRPFDELRAQDGRSKAVRGEPAEPQAWQEIAGHFDTLFTTEHSIDQLKQTILQLAVMGKLVPQNPDDEPASVLLEKIAKEKKRLIKEGKIKKQKTLPEITDDEKPFDLPEGWEWARIVDFTIVGTGSTPARGNTDYYFPAELNWVTSGETSDDYIGKTKEKISQLAVNETNVSIYPAGTLIVAMYGQGKTRGQISELLIEAGTNQACAAIQPINDAVHHRKYIKLFFKKAYEELRSHSAGGAQPNLNVGKISKTVIPLPPLAEQHRIVAKADELMALCDNLKTHLNTAQVTQLQLADAIVEKAVA